MNQATKFFSDNKTAKALGIVGGVAAGGVWTTALVYLGVYGYKNPDPS